MLSQISTDQQSNSHIQSAKISESNPSSTLSLKVPDQSESLSEQIQSRKQELDNSLGQEQQQLLLSSIGRWTDEEHKRFEEALAMYHKDWKMVEKHVGTRSSAQIRSHAQKYFNKQRKMRKAQQLSSCSSFCCGRALDDTSQFGSSQQIWQHSCICRDSNDISYRIQQSNQSAHQSLHSNQACSISDQFKCKIPNNYNNNSNCTAKCCFNRNPSYNNHNTNKFYYPQVSNTTKEQNTQNTCFLADNNSLLNCESIFPSQSKENLPSTTMDLVQNANHQNCSYQGSSILDQQKDNFPSLFKQSLLSHLSNLLRISTQQEYQASMNSSNLSMDLNQQSQNLKQQDLTEPSKTDRNIQANTITTTTSHRIHTVPQDLKRKNSFSLCSQQLSHAETSLMKVEQLRKKLCTEIGPSAAGSSSSSSYNTMVDNSAKNVPSLPLSSLKNEIINPIVLSPNNSTLLTKNPSLIIKDRQQQQSGDNSSINQQDSSKLDQTQILVEAFQRFLQQQQQAASNYQAQQSSQLNSLILDLTKSITQTAQVSSKQS